MAVENHRLLTSRFYSLQECQEDILPGKAHWLNARRLSLRSPPPMPALLISTSRQWIEEFLPKQRCRVQVYFGCKMKYSSPRDLEASAIASLI